jgi:hypothetical protein
MFRLQYLLILTLSAAMLTLAQPAKAEAQTLTCPAGVPITLTGSGPARAGYLLYFGSRAVGGGSVKADGHFSINLVIGRERPGDYEVLVRLRGTPQILFELTCSVPAVDSAVASVPIVVAAPVVPSVTPDAINHSGFTPQGSACPADYPIKGNINSSGEYIYHTDASRSYDRTIPEHCFATEEDALDAGYRAALDT